MQYSSCRTQGTVGASGKQGPRGPGVINWTGKWSSSREYHLNDAIRHNGQPYICVRTNTNETPDQSSIYWDLIAERGHDGRDGDMGPKGERGIQGEGIVGPKGDRGEKGCKGNGFEWKGAWSFSSKYSPNDIVTHRGSTYVCIGEHSNQVPPTPSYWNLFVQKGDTGSQGLLGSQGPTGENGKDGISLNWRSEWTPDATYKLNDAVSYRGSSYICLDLHGNQEPPNASYWGLLAGKGDTGASGRDGWVLPGGRLTLIKSAPVVTNNVESDSVYYVPYVSDMLQLWNGTNWVVTTFDDKQITIPKSADTNFDVFAHLSNGQLAIELTGWKNDNQRAKNLVRFQGRTVREDDPAYFYLGSFRTNGQGKASDRDTTRFLFNAFHRLPRLFASDDVEMLIGLAGVTGVDGEGFKRSTTSLGMIAL